MISIIICSITDSKLSRVASLYATLLQGEEYEIIAIRDAKSLCEGYNRGFRQSKGSLVIFCHDDIEIVSPGFSTILKHALEEHDVVGVVGTTAVCDGNWSTAGQPHMHGVVVYPPGIFGPNGYLVNVLGAETPVMGGMQGLDGLFIAAKREVVERVGFDEQTFDGFHGYDIDFTFSAYLAGFRLAVCTGIVVVHDSRGAYDEIWSRYNERFLAKHAGKLYSGTRGVTNGGFVRLPDIESVVRLCNGAKLAELSARLRSRPTPAPKT